MARALAPVPILKKSAAYSPAHTRPENIKATDRKRKRILLYVVPFVPIIVYFSISLQVLISNQSQCNPDIFKQPFKKQDQNLTTGHFLESK
ncbi:hypothetical protein A2V82_14345 [candidate division KSB1 bacterium RBG_16_48_16]|nr:MAG: hypothetical protein A2V82_14345 [candidate division KSB1 bacterium RBG_16_48_16]